jgi:hypothetical protein
MPTYLAGPISGVPDGNAEAFRSAAAYLRGEGMDVLSPTERLDGETNEERGWEEWMRRDLKLLLIYCDSIAVLPGWEESRGASLEVYVARQLGMAVVSALTREAVPPSTATARQRTRACQAREKIAELLGIDGEDDWTVIEARASIVVQQRDLAWEWTDALNLEQHCYIGRCSCGAIRAVVVEDKNGQWPENIATMVRLGLAVDRVPLAAAKAESWQRRDGCRCREGAVEP